MSNETLRMLAMVVFAAMLMRQAYQARTNVRRRTALSAMAGGTLALLGYTALLSTGSAGIFPMLMFWLGLILFVVGIIFFVISFDKRELAARRAIFQAELEKERQRRAAVIAKREARQKKSE